VIGIDCFLDYYPRAIKEDRIKEFINNGNIEFIEDDLLNTDLKRLIEHADVIIHEAAQPGPRVSWGDRFESYSRNNIEATQKLLEAAADKVGDLKKFIYASSSSVYGDPEEMPTKESSLTRPISPYGVTKLAGEHLCYAYFKNFNIPTVILRHFTVFGPKPRPDMAHTIFSKAILSDKEICIFGDGEQSRGFTHVYDIVDATLSAANSQIKYDIFNIGGGITATINEMIGILENIIGKKATIRYTEAFKGDTKHTYPDISKAQRLLNYKPKVGLEEGLAEVVCSVKEFYNL
jgi:UDP-glucose 4-epimerase